MTSAEYTALRAVNWALHIIETKGVQADPQVIEQLRIALQALEKA